MEEQTENTIKEDVDAFLIEQKLKELQNECQLLSGTLPIDKKRVMCQCCFDSEPQGKSCSKGFAFRANFDSMKQKLFKVIMLQQAELNEPKSEREEKRFLARLSELGSSVENISSRIEAAESNVNEIDKKIDSAFRKKASL